MVCPGDARFLRPSAGGHFIQGGPAWKPAVSPFRIDISAGRRFYHPCASSVHPLQVICGQGVACRNTFYYCCSKDDRLVKPDKYIPPCLFVSVFPAGEFLYRPAVYRFNHFYRHVGCQKGIKDIHSSVHWWKLGLAGSSDCLQTG